MPSGPTWLRAWEEVVKPAWPAFMLHDAVCNEHWSRLTEEFGELQLYLIDDADGSVVGWGNTIPFAWDGTVESLPVGIDGVLPLGVHQREEGVAPNTLSALQAVVRTARQGEGLSALLIRAMAELARRHGLGTLVAPVRPSRKADYPLTPIASYVGWTRPDGLPRDPWLRVHARLGAEILDIAAASMDIRGTVADWEEWSSMEFPESGEYVVPGALVPVTIDRERDEGRYLEPNVWMRHPRAALDENGTA